MKALQCKSSLYWVEKATRRRGRIGIGKRCDKKSAGDPVICTWEAGHWGKRRRGAKPGCHSGVGVRGKDYGSGLELGSR